MGQLFCPTCVCALDTATMASSFSTTKTNDGATIAAASTSKTMLTASPSAGEKPVAPPFTLSRASKDIAFGSIAGMVSKVFEHPFDLVKVRLQTQPSDRTPPMYAGAIDCFKQTYIKEGARGLFRGLSMPVFGATLENATLFFTYNFVQGHLRKVAGLAGPASSSSLEEDAEKPLSMGYLAIAAACAGSITSVVLTPVELIKCKMQVQMVAREVEMLARAAPNAAPTSASTSASARSATAALRAGPVTAAQTGVRQLSSQAFAGLDGPLTILRTILRRDGVRGLWVGQTGTLLRETGGGVAWFLAFEWACRKMIEAKRKASPGSATVTKKDLKTAELIGAGAMAGISYNVVLFPADSVKSTMQTEREWFSSAASHPQAGAAAKATAYKPRGFLSTLANIYRTRGVRGLYAGCGVTCMRSAPSSALIFLLYNRLEALADDYGI